ncbi:MAG TPA: hypothetical protein VGU68_03915 [Ktedonobacteraceae bacterium]|nr:hypothetical protein [Ktedonobacteraceae bacterium]
MIVDTRESTTARAAGIIKDAADRVAKCRALVEEAIMVLPAGGQADLAYGDGRMMVESIRMALRRSKAGLDLLARSAYSSDVLAQQIDAQEAGK